MKFRIENGAFVGTAEWREAGDVEVDATETAERRFLEQYFSTPYTALGGSVDCPEMQHEDPDSSPHAFERAMNRLAEHEYTVRRVDGDSTAEPHRKQRRSA
jgi:hypothetical protein